MRCLVDLATKANPRLQMEENKQTKEERYSLRSAALFLAALGCRATSAWIEQPKPLGWSTAAIRMAYTSCSVLLHYFHPCYNAWLQAAGLLLCCLWLEELQPRSAESSLNSTS